MAALGWDQGQVYSTAAVPGQVQVNSHSEITSLFYSFIQNYRLNNNFIYRYKTKIRIPSSFY
jgi:DNA replication licensing factor MCM5